jgi:cytochrome c553
MRVWGKTVGEALWAAALGLMSGSAAAAGPASPADLARAAEIVEGRCAICHGVDGESSSPLFPRLSAQHASYIERQLADYQSGRRKNETMQRMVEGLGAEEMRWIGAYFQAKPAQAHAVADAELAEVGRYLYHRGNPLSGVAACAACHGADGQGHERLPRVGGQHAQYVERQLKAFGNRERTNDNAIMHTVAAKLTELEVKAVAVFISGLK